MDASDLLLVVLDGSTEPDASVLDETAGRARLVVRAKSDLVAHPAAAALAGALSVSSLTGEGIATLLERLADHVARRAGELGDEDGLVATLRQIELLDDLHAALSAAGTALAEAPVEAALMELRQALSSVGAVLGLEVGDEVLDRIFSSFCLGK